MTRSKSRSNRLKRNKTKRYRQTKNKRRRQTKNKRRRQHGGDEYQYTRDSQTILKTGSVTNSVTNSVLIPGYSEIMDMMKEYEHDESEKLNEGIKHKDVQLIRECSLPSSIESSLPEGTIIVLRKEDKKNLLGVQDHNASIDCDPNQYYTLASHNFKIFIKDILGWNPFLNLPKKPIKIDTMHQIYNGPLPHVYSYEPKFKKDYWWNSQSWWTGYKETFTSVEQQPPAQSRTSSSQPPQSLDLSLILRQPQPLNIQLISVTSLINNNLQLTMSSLQELIKNSRQRHKYRNITSKIEELISSVQTLSHITPQINQLLTRQHQSS